MEKNVIITTVARNKLVKARAGLLSLPIIKGMAFGDGGADADGKAVPPNQTQGQLTNELLRKEISGCSLLEDEAAAVRYTCTLGEAELAGETISEIGLYDADGDLVCIKTFSPKGKDDDIEMTFTLDDVF